MSDPGWFRHWHFFHSGTGMIRCRKVRRSGIKKLQEGGKRNTLHVCTAGGVEAYTPQVHTAGIYRNVGPLLLKLLCETDKYLVHAGIPECRKKASPASTFLPAVNFVSPASVFGIRDSPVPLVTYESCIAQLWLYCIGPLHHSNTVWNMAKKCCLWTWKHGPQLPMYIKFTNPRTQRSPYF
jgi:hypothetical protein